MKLITTILLCTLFASCYNQRKASNQFHKSVLYYPNLATDYCAKTYPPDTTTVFKQGDSILVTDTLYGAGEIDTVVSKDTVYITRMLPAKVITKTIIRTDTITVTKINTALVASLQSQLTAAVKNEQDARQEVKEWRGKAKKRFTWLIVVIGLLGLGTYLRIRKVI